MNIDDYLVELLVDAILSDICRDTSEWADPTGDKAVEIIEVQEKHVL
jgi:hypothetical protein